MAVVKKPWLDKDGNLYSDAALKKLNGAWSLEVWEDFLKSNVEKSLHEYLPDDPALVDNSMAGYGDTYESMSGDEKFPVLGSHVRKYLSCLTRREQQIIEAMFWEERSQRDLARELRISRNAVVSARDRALRKLGTFMVHNLLSAQALVAIE